MTITGPVVIPKSVARVIERIRQSGMCNMVDRNCVQRQALRLEEHAALIWLEDHAHEYGRLILAGCVFIDDTQAES